MRTNLTAQCACSLYLGSAVIAFGQQPPAPSADAKTQQIAAFKQSLAENKKSIRQYSWIETTQISLKGEVKKTEQKQCRYGPDGQVVKTPLGGPPAQPQAQGDGGGRRRGGGAIKEKVIEKKVDEMKDYMAQVAGLVKQYVPPEPAKIQACQQAGKAALNREISPGVSELAFSDYSKPGDKLTLGFKAAAKTIDHVNVNSYLGDAKDAVTLAVRFASLPDGVNYPAEINLVAKAKEIQVKITHSDYKKGQ
ncbi:MAG TPA: hypothetical protein VEX68_28730 [Bryobacteraceae bacterium]|nr:hypothetical protein [Bryobacteraceae bacterium]